MLQKDEPFCSRLCWWCVGGFAVYFAGWLSQRFRRPGFSAAALRRNWLSLSTRYFVTPVETTGVKGSNRSIWANIWRLIWLMMGRWLSWKPLKETVREVLMKRFAALLLLLMIFFGRDGAKQPHLFLSWQAGTTIHDRHKRPAGVLGGGECSNRKIAWIMSLLNRGWSWISTNSSWCSASNSKNKSG